MRNILLFLLIPFLGVGQKDTIDYIDYSEWSELQHSFKDEIMSEEDAIKHTQIIEKYEKLSFAALERGKRGKGKGNVNAKAVIRKKRTKK